MIETQHLCESLSIGLILVDDLAKLAVENEMILDLIRDLESRFLTFNFRSQKEARYRIFVPIQNFCSMIFDFLTFSIPTCM